MVSWGITFPEEQPMKKVVIPLLLVINIEVPSEEVTALNYKSLSFKVDFHELTLSNEERIIPVYTEMKYYFLKDKNYKPFIKGEVGFNYVDEGSDGEEAEDIFENNYYSIGGGVALRDLLIEIAFANYSVDYRDDVEGVSENRIVLKIEYKY